MSVSKEEQIQMILMCGADRQLDVVAQLNREHPKLQNI